MASVAHHKTFIYKMDNEKSLDENLNEIFKNIKFLTGDRDKDLYGRFDFEIRLDVLQQETEEKIDKAMQRAKTILEMANPKNELVPVAMDRDGEMLYKRRG